MNDKIKIFEEMTFPVWVCCTQELSKFQLEEMLPVDQLFRNFLTISTNVSLDMEATLIFIAKITSHLKEIELILDSRDRDAYKAMSDYMHSMLEACAQLCRGAKTTIA